MPLSSYSQSLDDAKKKYAERSFEEDSTAAQEALDLAVAVIQNEPQNIDAILLASKAAYFVADKMSEEDSDAKGEKFLSALSYADMALNIFNVDIKKLPTEEADAKNAVIIEATGIRQLHGDVRPIATAAYMRSISLGSWGSITLDTSRLPELINSLLLVIELDESTSNFGAPRVLGKVYANPFGKADALTGGEHLQASFENSLHPQLGISFSGSANNDYASFLIEHEEGGEQKAKAILEKFIATPVEELDKNKNSSVELKKAQEKAKQIIEDNGL